jgi:predicted DNA-binding transcriptional regulator AlpA
MTIEEALTVTELSRAETVRLWTVDDVATFLGVPIKTLYQWRTKGYGPAGIRVGRYIRYRSQDVIEWVTERQTAAS